MDKQNNNEAPLFKGGCGHTDEEVEECAAGCLVMLIIAALVVLIFFAFAFFAR